MPALQLGSGLPGDHLFGGGLRLYKRQFDPRWRDFQSIRDRAEPRKFTDEENSMAKPKKPKSIRKSKRNRPAQLESQDCTLGLSVVHPKAAGIDVGNEDHWVAIPPSLDPEPVRRFSCFNWDLIALANWLKSRGTGRWTTRRRPEESSWRVGPENTVTYICRHRAGSGHAKAPSPTMPHASSILK